MTRFKGHHVDDLAHVWPRSLVAAARRAVGDFLFQVPENPVCARRTARLRASDGPAGVGRSRHHARPLGVSAHRGAPRPCADASVAFEWHPSAYYVVALLTASGAVYAPSPSKPVRVSFDVVHARAPPPAARLRAARTRSPRSRRARSGTASTSTSAPCAFGAPGTYHIRFSAASKHFADLAPKECEVSVRLSASAAVAPEDDARTVSDRPPKKRRTEEAAPKSGPRNRLRPPPGPPLGPLQPPLRLSRPPISSTRRPSPSKAGQCGKSSRGSVCSALGRAARATRSARRALRRVRQTARRPLASPPSLIFPCASQVIW